MNNRVRRGKQHFPDSIFALQTISLDVTLGMIVQAVSGQSYESYITEHIFNPLDMQNRFAAKTEAQQAGLAMGYQKWFGIPVASPNWPFTRGSLPAGALNMSVEDFGYYLIVQLNDGNYHGVSVLSPAGIAELHCPDVQVPNLIDFMEWAGKCKSIKMCR